MDRSGQVGFVAGVGASAGGLESLERFFRAMPVDSGVAFIVVQHLSAEHKSLMEELMGRFTRVPVSDARDGEQIRPDHIYLLPPGKEIELHGDRLAIFDREPDRALSFPIDRFFNSLADSQGARAIAIVLSGSGSDGSRGVRRVSAQGGLVLVEDPQAAAFDGMPLAAIATGLVDRVLDADGLARALLEHASSGEVPAGDDARAIERIIGLLSERLGIDFNEYKRSTIFRRVLRRARMSSAPDLKAYTALLEREPTELTALQFDLLIGVTSFFRDAAWFASLETEIDALVRSAEGDREMRVWVAGCATGEEAYSIAMLFDEAMGRAGARRGFKIFATDVHAGAIKTASAGVYPPDRVKDVDETRLARYFTARLDGSYQVSGELRHHLVFTQHDLIADTPFTNLDLVSCRNMLIYLGAQAQRRALASLAYGLRVGGILFLGSSESPGDMAPHFDVVSETGKIFRKRVHSRAMHRPDFATRVSRRAFGFEGTRDDNRLMPIYDALLDRFMPQAFLVSEQRTLVDSYNGAEKLLHVAARRPSRDFVDMVPQSLRVAMAAGLARAQRDPAPVSYAIDWPLGDGTSTPYTLTVERLVVRNGEPSYLLSLWPAKAAAPEAAASTSEGADGSRLDDLEAELSLARHSLQSTVEELEASNEELQATNEELVASNEELQSVNEELHSVNEELHTVNAEHQLKIAELTELNRDISHLLESIDVATVYLDRDLRIRKYTPRASGIFGLVEHDVGRHLESFNHQLMYPGLMADVRSVRDGGPRVEMEVSSRDGHWYFVRLLPYRIGGDIQGVVVTLTDATALAAAKSRARQLSSIVDSIGDAIIGLSLEGTVLSWNDAAARLYGYTEAEMVGSGIDRLVPETEREAMAKLLQRVARGEDIINAAAVRVARNGDHLDIANTMSPVRDAMGTVVGIATIDRDIREQKRLERRIRESERRYEDLYNHAPDMYLSIDVVTGRILEFNETFLRMTGFSREEGHAMHALELYPADSQETARDCLGRIRQASAVNDIALRVKRKSAPPLDVTLSATAVFDAGGNVVGSRWVMRDVSARRQAELELAAAARMREEFLAMVSHELRSPLHAINAALQIVDSDAADEAQRRRCESVVRRQTRQMIRLVDDLLDVSRIIHGKLQVERLPMDISEVARAAADAMAPSFHAKGITLVTEGMEDPLPMFGDASRLTQVVTNILNNALRYTPEGRRVRVSCARDGGSAQIVVADEGRGIAAEELHSIFGMFNQSRQGLARIEGGLGLGLTIAERIVASHGGTITATSAGLGKGAQFTIRLPVDPRAVVAGPKSDALAAGRLSIVVVEDQDDAREILVTLLQMEGHEVVAARDGREGLAAILEYRPQIGLLDIGLPEMNGYDVAIEVRKRLGQTLRLVAMSGYGQSDDIRKAEEAGFDRHLTKPVDPRRLAMALRELGVQGVGPTVRQQAAPAG